MPGFSRKSRETITPVRIPRAEEIGVKTDTSSRDRSQMVTSEPTLEQTVFPTREIRLFGLRSPAAERSSDGCRNASVSNRESAHQRGSDRCQRA